MPDHNNPLLAYPGPHDVTRVELPNGITLLIRSNFTTPLFVLQGYCTVGSLQDPEDKLGMNVFTANLLNRGTRNRNFNQIFNLLESAGASLSFGGNMHTTSFNAKGLVEDLPSILDLLFDTLTQPVFPDDQVEKFRAQLLTALSIRAQDTAEMASLTFDQILYAGHPYRHPEEGYPETVMKITRQDLVNFHREYFGPRGMVIAIVGAVDPKQIVEQVTSRFSGWQNDLQPEQPGLPDLNILLETTRRNVSIPGKSQADIVMGCSGPTRNSPDFMPASLGNNILGVFGLMGRIGEVVREQSGLAYYAYTGLNAGTGPGSWEVSAGVNPENVEKAIRLIHDEVTRFINETVSMEELEDSQANYIGRLPLSMESNSGVAAALLSIERHHLGLDYYQRYESLVREVTREQILAVAQKYLQPEKMAIAVAGP